MDARGRSIAWIAVLLLVTMGASHRTPNFIVNTHDPLLARQIAEAAEQYRSQLSAAWLGESIPNWASPCTMTVQVGEHLGAGGATTFLFDRGEVYGWQMTIQGSRQRIFDSVLPHEITHMIFASHFRKPLPRWADEGAATSVECHSERQKQYQSLYQFLTTGRGIAFNQMFAMTEYPRDIMPLYAQGFSLTEYLIGQGGRAKYVRYLDEAMEKEEWVGTLRKHYGIESLGRLQNDWLAWIRDGRPAFAPDASGPVLAASHTAPLAPATTSPTSPAAVPSQALASTDNTEWRAASDRRNRHEADNATDYPNPYAVASSVESNAQPNTDTNARPKFVGGWLDPRPTTSPPQSPQAARQQPVQEASQLILEWHRR